MKKIFSLLLLTALNCYCASAPAPGNAYMASLKNLFRLCESDLEKAKKIIIRHDLIKMLTHLQLMDKGGDKYYLLEREGITSMIRSVTEGVYSDFILINKDGTVVYTMQNDGIFARNVRTTLGKTALNAVDDAGPFIASVSLDGYYIAVSSKISAPNTMPGIFVLLIDMKKIQRIVGEKSFIVSQRGTYEVVEDRQKINTAYSDFNRIDLSAPGNDVSLHRFSRSSGGIAVYRLFQYGNLRWVIITE